jgi:hypothetical protein
VKLTTKRKVDREIKKDQDIKIAGNNEIETDVGYTIQI